MSQAQEWSDENMDGLNARALHLHTIDSLVADLIAGIPVLIEGARTFSLPDAATRSALAWYQNRGPAAWSADVRSPHAEELVDTISQPPPAVKALPSRPANANNRRLRLKRVEAHRFAGLHKFGTPDAAPENYVHEFSSPITLFEGRNGSGKTSLLNTVIWTLTGQMLRPQREPENPEDFDCWIGNADERTTHKLSSLTPMPLLDEYRPDKDGVPADTWVELTFVDDGGVELPPIRRSITRSLQGKLKELPPDLSALGVDPIALRIGTVMPALLPLIRLGSESELGRAVSELTGLSALVDLAAHTRRAKTKIDKDLVKAKRSERDKADGDYNVAKGDLEKILRMHAALEPPIPVPVPSDDKAIEEEVKTIKAHFDDAKASAFESAKEILGGRFDPADAKLRSDLEENIGRALERVSQLQTLKSIARLADLRKLTPDELGDAENKLTAILTEARTLQELAQNPSSAARTRLYARIKAWMTDHPDPARDQDRCVVCGGDHSNAVDPVTGQPVKQHLAGAASDANLLSQTLAHWTANAHGDLLRSLPEALRAELVTDLPSNPCDLLRKALVDEAFSFAPFAGILGELKSPTALSLDGVFENRAELDDPIAIALPAGCTHLQLALERLDRAIRFARWRQNNDALAREVLTRVLGRKPKEGEPAEKLTLTGKLLELQNIVKAAEPISDALTQCARLSKHFATRRAAETRLANYATASTALGQLADLGTLADQQVDQLRKILRTDAAAWRDLIYLGAFPDTAHRLVDTGMGRKGELDLVVQAGGVAAPAQHVTNASALRASLVAFFFAFWQHVLKERGGLTILVLDDPQELLDDENRERLAAALGNLASGGAQVIVTSYDPRFSGRVAKIQLPGGVEHLAVHPATRLQPRVRTIVPHSVLLERKKHFDADQNEEESAREFADGCRVFLEAQLGDMFDDPAHSSWAKATPNPTLADFVQRMRPLVRAGSAGMFGSGIFRRFAEHPALGDNSAVVALMNKAHHGRRLDITAGEVAQCAGQLVDLIKLAEDMREECYRWRRRDAPEAKQKFEAPAAIDFTSLAIPRVVICPDLAAFTRHRAAIGTQDEPEILDTRALEGCVAYYLRRANFGFAAPAGSLAIVRSIATPSADRRLVIARHSKDIYARRLVRSANGGLIGLTAEIPDPRIRNPKTVFLPEDETAIHQVVGVIFDHRVRVDHGPEEAVAVDANRELQRIVIAFRVVDESAVPLALDKQVVLGGDHIELDTLGHHQDALVALFLDEGSSIFKRVGSALPGDLSHLRLFESIGGMGSSQVLSVGKAANGVPSVVGARKIVGVLYNV
ncbi:AAA family ATPase [Mesorhizobium huakuii]|uniref:AAA family ATPase n=1 Tax=Mesorhizobium huakuii TaxID=28104 RepID=A0A7G6T5T1_9HYPH|nr:AAA family ATPase [Mesorhizobium huakuii]QND62113.1 AAA family ATPase [Mesorhizobium huakuii]